MEDSGLVGHPGPVRSRVHLQRVDLQGEGVQAGAGVQQPLHEGGLGEDGHAQVHQGAAGRLAQLFEGRGQQLHLGHPEDPCVCRNRKTRG